MAITQIHIAGYRSVRRIWMQLRQANVLVGPNGCGKSNLYKSLFLLAKASSGQLSQALALEGGMPSVLWAGPRQRGRAVQVKLHATVDELRYELTLGLSAPRCSAFRLDPLIKEEKVVLAEGDSNVGLLERKNETAWLRGLDGRRALFPHPLSQSESVLSQLREPHLYPELSALRETMSGWRFYHHFRTDPQAPVRQRQTVFRTPVLHHEGGDLAAALLTILEEGDGELLERSIDEAFPGSHLRFLGDENQATYQVALQMPEHQRPFDARELSDGTLRYLCLIAALLSPQPPQLVAVNEPEMSLHPDLLPPLAQLIARAGNRSQLWITTHSQQLASLVKNETGQMPIVLEKLNGETQVAGHFLVYRSDADVDDG